MSAVYSQYNFFIRRDRNQLTTSWSDDDTIRFAVSNYPVFQEPRTSYVIALHQKQIEKNGLIGYTNLWYATLQCLLALRHGPSGWLVASDILTDFTSLTTNHQSAVRSIEDIAMVHIMNYYNKIIRITGVQPLVGALRLFRNKVNIPIKGHSKLWWRMNLFGTNLIGTIDTQ